MIVELFRDGLAKLEPRNAYDALQDMATKLAVDSLVEADSTTGPDHIASLGRFSRSRDLLRMLAGAYDAYRRKDFGEVNRTGEKISAHPDSAFDRWSAIDAQHLIGRVQLDEGCLAEAEQSFFNIMNFARESSYAEGFVRAIHEISRVKAENAEVLHAEAGFRVALDYYTSRASRLNAARNGIPPDAPHMTNIQMALNCLGGLADTYFELSRGPTEAIQLIDFLASDFFSSRDDTAYDFLEIRGLALNVFTREAVIAHTATLVGKAMKLYAEHRVMALYALEEAASICDFRGVTYPSTIRHILARPESFNLRRVASFKPEVCRVESAPPTLCYTSPSDAADSVQQLFDYLETLDAGDRFVYRGQVREYDGPLLPSAFRPILKQPFPLEILPCTAPGIPSSLRRCGRLFIGEYNECFKCYADVMKRVREAGVGQAECERIFAVYKKLLDDRSIALNQDQEAFVPWQDAAQQELSDHERQIYGYNSREWDPRINNYHRRLLRDNLLVRLFGYTLGTTFAQQYGLSSEGLDASKSLAVACFFATHDPADFVTVVDQGLGIVYRFPFPLNDIGTRPLSAFTYYNLPSIIDVEDVFYRFEHDGLRRSDSVACMLSYLSSVLTYGLQSTDMMLLPRGFLRSSRVHSQEAVIVIPDEIREDLPNRRPGPGGVTFPKYRYVEDLGSRRGVTRFYFKHTEVWPDKLKSITREHLWPRQDSLLDTLILLIASSYCLRQTMPKRLDLIDGGYAPDEFFKHCRDLYDRYRYEFFTGYEQVARKNFNLIL
ncbi:MAG: hypothetical protein H8E44_43135 [Planctomycetes bacterium]|nr:hypothetical protein [Planctomycetota bacterium]